MWNKFEVGMVDFDKDIEKTFGLSTLLPRSLNMTRRYEYECLLNLEYETDFTSVSYRTYENYALSIFFLELNTGGA